MVKAATKREVKTFEEFVASLPRKTNGEFEVPRKPRNDQVATFVAAGAAGSAHRVSLRGTQYETRTPPSGGAPRDMPIPNSAMIVKFDESNFCTSDPNWWVAMLDEKMGFGNEYTINAADPTGFWQASGYLRMSERIELEPASMVSPQDTARIALQNSPSQSTSGAEIVSGVRTTVNSGNLTPA